MKKCELCDSPAKMYCESDQASLCWDCDAQVHSANFLVSKHSRRLLCHVCQSLTPWNGSGPKLLPTVSVCDSCVNSCNQNEDDDDLDREDNTEDGDDDDGDDDDDDDGDGDEDQGDNNIYEDDDEENQVVPWSSTPPPPVSSSSTSEEGLSDSRKPFSWKSMSENAEFNSQNDQGSWSSQLSHKQIWEC